MTISLSEREAVTIMAALIVWKDPLKFLSNGNRSIAALFQEQPELAPEQLDFLIRRIKSIMNVKAGERFPTKP